MYLEEDLSLFCRHLHSWQAIVDKGRQNVHCGLEHLQQLPPETTLELTRCCHDQYAAFVPIKTTRKRIRTPSTEHLSTDRVQAQVALHEPKEN